MRAGTDNEVVEERLNSGDVWGGSSVTVEASFGSLGSC